jgi:hypothetical protein
MRHTIQIGIASIAIAILLCAQSAITQSTNSGDIRGTVTDNTGALIPNVEVKVLNIDTGVSTDYATNQDGLFDTSSILPGEYKITFTKQGFETLVRGPVTLPVGYITVNATLNVGATTQQVMVTSNVPLLQTESGDQTVTLEERSLSQLPMVNQDWTSFMVLLPGTSSSGSNNTGAPGMVAAADGNLPYTNVLQDGASTSFGQSNNEFSQGGIDALAELQISESSFSAQYGMGGMIMSKITKSGTDRFHGDAYDYIQNNAFNSNPHYFEHAESIPVLRYNDFGGSVGGPVLKQKMFFFFNFDQTVDHGGSNNGTSTVPGANIQAGNFSSINYTIYDPTTQTIAYDSLGNPYPVRKSFMQEYGTNAIPAGLIDSVAKAAEAYYPTATSHIAGGSFEPGTVNATTGVLANNWYTSLPNSNPWRKYTGRLDYDITQHNRLTASVSDLDNPALGRSNITACPLGCQSGDQEIENSQVSDVWNISSSVINEARMGYTWGISAYPDNALDHGYAAAVGWKFGKADQFPNLGLSNYAGLSPASNSVYKQHVFDPSDVVTMIRGKHILHFGGELLFYRNDNTNWGNINAGQMSFDGRYTRQWTVSSANCPAGTPSGNTCAAPNESSGLDYADFLLGLSNNWSAGYSPEFGARMKYPEVFVQDDYKMRPNLTINIGLRYEISHGWNEVTGNEDTFDPTVANDGGLLGAMWYGSTHANGRTSMQANVLSTFLPRVGFSWLPWANTTVRGGFGVYDHAFSMDMYGGGLGSAFSSSGNDADQSNGIWPVVQLDGTGTVCSNTIASGLNCGATQPALPYISASTAADAYNGQSVSYNPYHAPVQKIYEWTASVQRQLRSNLVAQVSYVGSHAWGLIVSNDINAVPATKLSSNDTIYRPYTLFQNISGNDAAEDGVSNYNSLQAEITQRVTSGLSFSFNYVWSHFLDDEDSAGWCCQAGNSNYQIANDSAANYSNANFDVRQAAKGYAVYQLPFGKGMQFLNKNSVADAVIGGWQVTGSMDIFSGHPFTVIADGNTYEHANGSSQFPNWNSGVSAKPSSRNAQEWFNPGAFTKPADGTFGNVRRNSLYGPAMSQVNLSGSKFFALPWEGIKFQIRIDAFNALNHTSWNVPGGGSISLQSASGAVAGADYVGPTSSQITSSAVSGRTVQLGGRLSF